MNVDVTVSDMSEQHVFVGDVLPTSFNMLQHVATVRQRVRIVVCVPRAAEEFSLPSFFCKELKIFCHLSHVFVNLLTWDCSIDFVSDAPQYLHTGLRILARY